MGGGGTFLYEKDGDTRRLTRVNCRFRSPIECLGQECNIFTHTAVAYYRVFPSTLLIYNVMAYATQLKGLMWTEKNTSDLSFC